MNTEQPNILDCTTRKMNRENVYEVLDGERDYQDSMPKDRTNGEVKQVGSFLSLMQHTLNEAHAAHYLKQSDTTALEFIRKLTAMGVQCMEIHGAPERIV